MNGDSPIYIVDDDQDDQDFVKEIFGDLKIHNQLLFFNSGNDVLSHLRTSKQIPLIILCDVNIPVMDGFELRKTILEDQTLVYKSVPFIFWSNFASNAQVKKAFDLSVHGFFIKGKNYAELKTSLQNIFAYWQESMQPES